MPAVTPVVHTGASQCEFPESMPQRLRAPSELESHEQSWYSQLRRRCGTMRAKRIEIARQMLVGSHNARTATARPFALEGTGRPCGSAKGKG